MQRCFSGGTGVTGGRIRGTVPLRVRPVRRSGIALVAALALTATAGCGGGGDDTGDDVEVDSAVSTTRPEDDATDEGPGEDAGDDGVIACEDGEPVEIGSPGNDVTVEGECGDIDISSVDNEVEIASATSVSVSGTRNEIDVAATRVLTVIGTDHEVDVGTVASMVVSGNGHEISCDEPTDDITDNSNTSEIDC